MDDSLKDRAIIKAPAVPFENVHHAHERELRVGPDLPPSGGSDGVEHVWRRCRQCGFVLNTDKTNQGNPYGNLASTPCIITADDGSTSVSTKAKDSVIGAGCPFCGSSEY